MTLRASDRDREECSQSAIEARWAEELREMDLTDLEALWQESDFNRRESVLQTATDAPLQLCARWAQIGSVRSVLRQIGNPFKYADKLREAFSG